ncbi:glutamine synthetase [Candidatus Woesearchaeota archaeon]|nr:glutamine synthetase [Candidatus Woesearchaeota archaeon]
MGDGTAAMKEKTLEGIFEQLDKNGVKRIMVSFSDMDGRIYHPVLLYNGSAEDKNRIAEELQYGGQRDGVANGWLPTDGSSFPGFDLDTCQSDMVIAADLDTFRIWKRKEPAPDGKVQEETVAHLWGDIKNPDGSEYACCPRTILKRAVALAKEHGVVFTAGSEQEFFVSKVPRRLVHIDDAIYYQEVPIWLSDAALDMRARGIETDYIHHEVAASQFEIRVKYKDALSKADDVLLYKIALQEAARLQGLSITFMPKPQDGINGSGMHVHWGMFSEDGKNLMHDPESKTGFSREGEGVVAALMHYANESAIVHNPTINSYRRLKPGYEAPTVVCWGSKNRTAMFRQPAERTRIENRVLDGVGSPHLKFALLIHAALYGSVIHAAQYGAECELDAPVKENVFHSDVVNRRGLDAVPQNFGAAIKAAKNSNFLKEAFGERAYNRFMDLREQEWSEYKKDTRFQSEAIKLAWECKRYWDR